MSDKSDFILKNELNADRVLDRREALFNALESFVGKKISGPRFDKFVFAVYDLLPGKIEYDVLRESLRSSAGLMMTRQLLDQTCWRLAGNIQVLQQFRPVYPWARQKYREMVIAQICDVKLVRGGKKGRELGHSLSFRILTGSASALKTSQWWSLRKAHYMARFKTDHGYGFKFPAPHRELVIPSTFKDTKQYYGMRCILILDPKMSDEDGPGFREISHSASTTAWNADMIKQRQRVAGYECVAGFPQTVECFQCYIGRDRCGAATHSTGYIKKACDKCEKETWFDPSDTFSKFCLSCTRNAVLKNEEEE